MKNSPFKKSWLSLLSLAFFLSATLISCTCGGGGKKPPKEDIAQEKADPFPITDDMLKAVEAAIADPGKGEEFRFLLQGLQDLKAGKQVDINAQNNQSVNGNSATGSTLLHYAVRVGHLGVIKALLKRGADLNAEDFDQNTPLIEATNEGHTDVVKFLLGQPGINVNAVDIGTQTALYIAAEKGYLEMVMLLAGRSDIDINKAYDDNGALRTARNIAQHMHDGAGDPLKKATYQQIIEELKRRGCNP
jgi:hypothetical protein